MCPTYYSSIAHTFQNFSVTYSNRLFNHFPMTITSLEELGASTAQLQRYNDYYCERLVSCENEIDDENNELTGLEQHQVFYLAQLNELGIKKTLEAELPSLINGIGAGNFYALNRLASGIKQENSQEIAMSLALWKTLHLDLGELGNDSLKRPTSLLRHVSKKIGHIRFSAGNTTDRMNSVITLVDYQQTPHQPQFIDFVTLANATATIYKMSGDFTMLHSVTGCWSLKTILPYVDDETTVLRYFWQATLVAYLSAGSPAMTFVDKISLSPWPQLIDFCCQSNNEHLIDLCYACHHLFQETELEIYHQIASRYVAIYTEPAPGIA